MGASLVTRLEYKNYIGISSTNEDDIIDILIPKISEFIKTYCRRTLIDYAFIPKTEIFSGGDPYIVLEEFPVQSINSFEYSTDYGQTYTALTEYVDYVVSGYKLLSINDVFTERLNGYKVVYTGGFIEIPEDLKIATMDLVTYYRRNDGSTHSVKLTNTSTMQLEYISDTSLPAYIRRILDYYIADYT